MALPVTNDYSGRQIRIVTTGKIPLANFKVKEGLWTGGTSGSVLSFVDVAGREFDFIYPASGDSLKIGELGWLSGPVTVTAMPGGELLLILATK